MSTIFGIRKPVRATVSERELLHLAEATERFAPDGLAVRASGRVGMGVQPYYTHARSKLESGPVTDDLGNLLSFDGRLDNYRDLAHELNLEAAVIPDSRIALAAFVRWGEACFSRLVGDWAIALWSGREQFLYLARDHAGTRTLYCHNDKNTLRWSTHLETFFVGGHAMELDEDYAACYLASRPIRDLTPYKGIRSVLPAHYLIVQNGKVSRKPHWEWMVRSTIRYNSDKDYEEHFFALFKQSVERRTGPGAPILAQLSGGMDSTSIVCMSDHIRRSRDPNADILDTISYYDDSEPSWNERPYFSLVEAARGKVGLHLETSFLQRTFDPPDSSSGRYLLPGADNYTIHQEHLLHEFIHQRGYRIVLSGAGGDQVTGGVPIPLPELADHLLSGHITQLLSGSVAWCLTDRDPLIKLMFNTLKYAALLYLRPQSLENSIPHWLPTAFHSCCTEIANRDVTRKSRFGSSACSIDNAIAWWSIMDTLPHLFPTLLSRLEYRYPFLDRDLVDYLFRVPREQLLRPARRRSLMRRSIAHLVPREIIEHRRKAYQSRAPILAMQHAQDKLYCLFSDSRLASLELIQPTILQQALHLIAGNGDLRWWPHLIKAIAFEIWLRSTSTAQKLVAPYPLQTTKRLPT